MDKQTILAFLLIGVILLAMPYYQSWLVGKHPPVSPQQMPAGTDSSEVRISSTAGGDARAELSSAVPEEGYSGAEREIVLENDLFISRWSTRGGLLKGWVLKGYSDGQRGLPVELIRKGGAGCVLFVDGEDLSEVHFLPSADSLRVRGNEIGDLIWVAQWKTRRIEKRVRLSGSRYDMEIEIRTADGGQRCQLDWRGGIEKSESSQVNEQSLTRIITYVGGVIENWDFTKAKDSRSRPSGAGGWIGLRNKYFLVAFVPQRSEEYGMVIDGKEVFGERSLSFGLVSESQRGSWNGSLYGGPISYTILGEYYDGELRQAMSWGWEWARGFMEPIGVGILRVFLAIHHLVPNYGFVIILFSFLVKIVLYPLTHKSYEATGRMQEIQPQIAALREKYQKDQQRLNQEMMKMYKEQGINPLGGCLPVLFQMPILFALFNVFQNAIELRQAHFVGWITDLSQPEGLMLMGVHVHMLPILMAVTMFLQQKSTIKDPSQKMMVYLMPVMMVFFFWGVSSGLVLYWTMFNLLSWLQQVGIDRVRALSARKG